MKKISLVLIILLFVQSFYVFAQDKSSGKKVSGIPDRLFEMGFGNINVNFANNFLTLSDAYEDVIVIDLDNLANGFKFNFGLTATPFYFNIKSKKGAGFGISTNVDAMGIINLSGNMLTLNEANNESSDVSGAVFSSAAVNTFFNLGRIKVKFSPSMFYTLAYVTPPKDMPSSVVYNLDYSDGTVGYINYAARLYLPFSLEKEVYNYDSFNAKPGFDFTVGLEYPVAKAIGLAKILPFLDFDLGVDLINIPFLPSTLSDYVLISGRAGSDKPIKIINKDDDDDYGDLYTLDEIVYGKDELKINRPFKVVAHADWRPLFGMKLLTLTPVFGFCHNELYTDPFSLEAGINACLNLGNFLLFKAGVNYTDRMYVNSVGFTLNIRLIQFDVGADVRSHDFNQSFKGAGLGVNFGLKLGW